MLLRSQSDRFLSRGRYGWATLLIGVVLIGSVSCSPKTQVRPGATAPAPTFSGPRFLHGSIGSLTTVRGLGPQMVSGFGLVVGLEGTGSSITPAALRTSFLNLMRKQGVKNPIATLNSPNTALVRIRALIPPGAVKDTRFDLLIEALEEDTQTTSLYGGKLYTADLAPGGANMAGVFIHTVAEARGAIYIDPLKAQQAANDPGVQHRRAVILSGGSASVPRRVDLVLNQQSWSRAEAVSRRINEVFPHELAAEFFNTAVAKSDQVIEVNLPQRFDGQPVEFLNLVGHLYLQRSEQMQVQQAHYLAELIADEPAYTRDAIYCWRAMGRQIIPALRRHYEHSVAHVRMAALEAGARLEDPAVAAPLDQIAQSDEAAVRRRVAEILQYLTSHRKAALTLMHLIDDEDLSVRLRAYESMLAIGDTRIERFLFGDESRFKFVFDLVPSHKPMIYVVHERMPRIVIFDPTLKLRPASAGVWDNRLMLKTVSQDNKLDIYYLPAGEIKGRQYQIQDNVAALIDLLASRANDQFPQPGLDLSYGHVVDVLHELHRAGHLQAELKIEPSRLADAVTQWEKEQYGEVGRPEIEPTETSATPLTDPNSPYAPLLVNDNQSVGETRASDPPDAAPQSE